MAYAFDLHANHQLPQLLLGLLVTLVNNIIHFGFIVPNHGNFFFSLIEIELSDYLIVFSLLHPLNLDNHLFGNAKVL